MKIILRAPEVPHDVALRLIKAINRLTPLDLRGGEENYVFALCHAGLKEQEAVMGGGKLFAELSAVGATLLDDFRIVMGTNSRWIMEITPYVGKESRHHGGRQ